MVKMNKNMYGYNENRLGMVITKIDLAWL